jgi:hypothetical protein
LHNNYDSEHGDGNKSCTIDPPNFFPAESSAPAGAFAVYFDHFGFDGLASK